MEVIGDIDQDGFEDIALSAPYLNDGVIYVYRGSESGLVLDLFQVSMWSMAGNSIVMPTFYN